MDGNERIMLIRTYADESRSKRLPVAFAGRETELGILARRLYLSVADRQGGVTVVQGIPGSGKTSLVERFCAIAQRSGVAVVHDGPWYLAHPSELMREIADAQRRVAGDDDRIRPLGEWFSTLELNLRVKVPFVDGGVGRRRPAEASESAPAVDRQLKEAGVRSDVPVVILADEAQTLSDAACETLLRMQTGQFDAPLFPLLAGLKPTVERLEDAGLSRLEGSALAPLGRLSDGQAEDCIGRTCREFGVEADRSMRVARLLAPGTGGFPAHVSAALSGVASVMERHRFALPPEAVRECRPAAAEYRAAYYERRLSRARGVPRTFFAVLARMVADDSRRADEPCVLSAREVAGACQAALDEDAQAVPGTKPLTVLESLVRAERAGVLDYDREKQEIEFPAAPSMARCILGIPEPPPLAEVEGG